jgi:hypothetical protein
VHFSTSFGILDLRQLVGYPIGILDLRHLVGYPIGILDLRHRSITY